MTKNSLKGKSIWVQFLVNFTVNQYISHPQIENITINEMRG
jgi:hypothetical protein